MTLSVNGYLSSTNMTSARNNIDQKPSFGMRFTAKADDFIWEVMGRASETERVDIYNLCKSLKKMQDSFELSVKESSKKHFVVDHPVSGKHSLKLSYGEITEPRALIRALNKIDFGCWKAEKNGIYDLNIASDIPGNRNVGNAYKKEPKFIKKLIADTKRWRDDKELSDVASVLLDSVNEDNLNEYKKLYAVYRSPILETLKHGRKYVSNALDKVDRMIEAQKIREENCRRWNGYYDKIAIMSDPEFP